MEVMWGEDHIAVFEILAPPFHVSYAAVYALTLIELRNDFIKYSFHNIMISEEFAYIPFVFLSCRKYFF